MAGIAGTVAIAATMKMMPFRLLSPDTFMRPGPSHA
jgi:hypothetical protein